MKGILPIILVVEDERPLLSAISKKLELNGFEVVTARSVSQAAGYLEDIEGISVVWLDHYLLGKDDGLNLVVAMKNDERWNKIPIFVVSNTATAEKKRAYIEFGVTRYYVKADYRLEDIIKDIKATLARGEEN